MTDQFSSDRRVIATTPEKRAVSEADIAYGARVEIIDPTGDQRALLPTACRVNGVDVGLIAENGISVESGSADEVTKVTLVLLASHVEIKSEEDKPVDLDAAVEVAKRECIDATMRLAGAQLAVKARDEGDI